jgi:hypothetical protein
VSSWTEDAEEEKEARRWQAAEADAKRAWKLLGAKKHRAAFDILEPLVLGNDDMDGWVYVNALYAYTDMPSAARRGIDARRVRELIEACVPHARGTPDVYLNAAFACVAIGDRDHAIRYLQQAKKRGSKIKKHLADRGFDPIRDDRRFLALQR